MSDKADEEYLAFEWLRSRHTPKDVDAYFRDVILYQLADTAPESVLQDTVLYHTTACYTHTFHRHHPSTRSSPALSNNHHL